MTDDLDPNEWAERRPERPDDRQPPTPERYRVEFYTERTDGTKEWCVCDYGNEGRTRVYPSAENRSPLVEDKNGNRTWTDQQAAQRFANAMNRLDAEE